ncbi:MAG: acyltransferase [Cycloclasticus sp.]|nr:MAG: acyltransferase [Cycloclasticus sp.]
MKALFKVLSLTIRTHGNDTAWLDGDVFLFNHFARFETFIPQYLIYEKTRLFSRSIASSDLFGDDAFSRYLIALGGIPNDAESLLYRVSKDILHQQKLIAFPEGGIVKDRRSVNDKGQYSIYSRSGNERRKLHTGPAVIALALTIFKSTVREINKSDDDSRLDEWACELGLKGKKELIEICNKPTLIIPCNITFYPLRIGENILKNSIQFFYKNLHKRLSEELLIEGNFLLKNTDMDIQIGEAIVVENYWTKIESTLTNTFVNYTELSLNDIFKKTQSNSNWDNLLFRLSYQRSAQKIRDAYMHAIYENVTLNIAHIAASIIMNETAKGRARIDKRQLHQRIYITIKILQKSPSLNFHRTLQNPAIYRNLLMTKSETFDQFLRSAYQANLLENAGRYYKFTEQLTQHYDFDTVRYKNPMSVYANEVLPIADVSEAIERSLSFKIHNQTIPFAKMLMDDELREFEWDLAQFQDEEFQEINQQQSFKQLASKPYFLVPKKHNGECVVLIHGLLSTPGELRALGEKLYNLGYVVIGCRLKGHGTSPWDLHQRNWVDWRQSVRQSVKIAHCYSKKVHLIGFSSGSLLALMMGANQHLHITSIVACSTPISFIDPTIHLAKAADFANKIIQKISWSEGLMPFKDNVPEHPHLNYRHIPISAINQLLILIGKTKPRLKKITCPTLLIQATDDPVVDPTSMHQLLNFIPKQWQHNHWVNSNRHGILYENTENCQQKAIDFIAKQSK